jgi:PAS domain S-box-containing protein
MHPPKERSRRGGPHPKGDGPRADSSVVIHGGERREGPISLDARLRAYTHRVEALMADAAPQHSADRRLGEELSAALEELCVAADELERRDALLDEAGAELVEQMRRYRELFDFAPDGYLVTDPHALIIEANIAAGEMLGRRPAELVNSALVAHVDPSDRARLMLLARDAAERPGVQEKELTLRPKRGGLLPVSVRVASSPGDGAPVLRWLLRGVAERRAAERRHADALGREREASARLRDMDAVKNAFLLAVSHDLRGPVTAVVSLARMLVDEQAPEDERAQRIAASIKANAARVERVQRDLLDLDRLARHAVVLQPTDVDLHDLLARAVAATDATDRPVSIRVRADTAHIDPGIAERILDNLLSNAVHHTPPNTPVEVSAEPWEHGVVLVVTDHGEGVPKALRQTVFGPLAGNAPLQREGGHGLGLGLHLVGRFATLHGGRAWIEDTAGGGAAIHVALAASP